MYNRAQVVSLRKKGSNFLFEVQFQSLLGYICKHNIYTIQASSNRKNKKG